MGLKKVARGGGAGMGLKKVGAWRGRRHAPCRSRKIFLVLLFFLKTKLVGSSKTFSPLFLVAMHNRQTDTVLIKVLGRVRVNPNSITFLVVGRVLP